MPKRYINSLRGLESDYPGLLACVSSGLQDIPLKLYPFEEVGEAIASAISEWTARSNRDVQDVKSASQSIFQFMYAIAFVDDEAMKDTKAEVIGGGCESAILDFIERLTTSGDTLNSFKASILYDDSPNTYEYARVVVDVRPVFSPGAKGIYSVNMIKNTLKITYRSSDKNDLDVMYITMTDGDLVELRSALSDAISKSEVIRNGIANSGGRVVGE